MLIHTSVYLINYVSHHELRSEALTIELTLYDLHFEFDNNLKSKYLTRHYVFKQYVYIFHLFIYFLQF